ncbi:MAG: DNA helicase RecQ [Proteobacteria bacterium]|nr:DNA helicase RecQ [Pseudomonadota bacterium]HQR03668.1 DNA helicase RecQ [Rhodocyclaceae bacterium]
MSTPDSRQLLHDVFGHGDFRGQQAEIVAHVATGGDALVLMPTGGGKSLCYQLPALIRHGCAIVVSPLIALMHDQVDALLQLDVRAAHLNSSLAFEEQMATERRLMQGDLDLLYVAPERLLTERFLGQLDRLYDDHRIALFAIDEAHCVSQWGHDFRPEYIQLSALHQRFPAVPRIALTATADAPTRREIVERLGLSDARQFVSSFDRPNIRYAVVERDHPKKQLLGFLAAHRGAAGIIYCLSRRKVDDTALWLQGQGIHALPYHAGLDAETRRLHQQRFVREDGVVMVATIAFGMGIDKPDVRFVAHLDLPRSLEAYYQETGRAGRDGEPAEAWMTYGLNDVVIHRQRIDESAAGEEQKRIERQRLDAMLAYCEAAACRRSHLLRYFGEEHAACNNCDTCASPPELWDGTIASQKLLSAALRTGQRFGSGHLIDVLLGRRNPKIEEYRHDQLPTYGVGRDVDEATWRAVTRQLLVGGILHADAQRFGAITLTAAARPVLKGETTLMLRRPRKLPNAGRAPRFSREETRVELDTADQAVFEALRAWRSGEAREQGVPAYVILHDRSLREIAQLRPASRAELLAIAGISVAKAERYGAALLRAMDESVVTRA